MLVKFFDAPKKDPETIDFEATQKKHRLDDQATIYETAAGAYCTYFGGKLKPLLTKKQREDAQAKLDKAAAAKLAADAKAAEDTLARLAKEAKAKLEADRKSTPADLKLSVLAGNKDTEAKAAVSL
jgi:hypothetical protein